MLVLSRHQGEAIHIGDDVMLVVNQIKGNSVSIAIGAPKATRIRRGEVERIPDGLDHDGRHFVYRENGKVICSHESKTVMEEWMDARDAASRRSD